MEFIAQSITQGQTDQNNVLLDIIILRRTNQKYRSLTSGDHFNFFISVSLVLSPTNYIMCFVQKFLSFCSCSSSYKSECAPGARFQHKVFVSEAILQMENTFYGWFSVVCASPSLFSIQIYFIFSIVSGKFLSFFSASLVAFLPHWMWQIFHQVHKKIVGTYTFS